MRLFANPVLKLANDVIADAVLSDELRDSDFCFSNYKDVFRITAQIYDGQTVRVHAEYEMVDIEESKNTPTATVTLHNEETKSGYLLVFQGRLKTPTTRQIVDAYGVTALHVPFSRRTTRVNFVAPREVLSWTLSRLVMEVAEEQFKFWRKAVKQLKKDKSNGR